MAKKNHKGLGYHLRDIPKGELGELSKVLEEVLEAQDGEEQSNKLLVLCELADIYGALRDYLQKKFPGFKMCDLKQMANATRRAFRSGRRK